MEDRTDSVLNRGCNAIGVAFDEAPQELLEAFDKAILTISKGMANYKTLS
ncbi:ARMT1-like domain-containing protein [Methanohalophilus sp. WG1-DM]|nr:ARMT1-like domain-containing protein [Methanohalophilus sp. WG1-DM]